MQSDQRLRVCRRDAPSIDGRFCRAESGRRDDVFGTYRVKPLAEARFSVKFHMANTGFETRSGSPLEFAVQEKNRSGVSAGRLLTRLLRWRRPCATRPSRHPQGGAAPFLIA